MTGPPTARRPGSHDPVDCRQGSPDASTRAGERHAFGMDNREIAWYSFDPSEESPITVLRLPASPPDPASPSPARRRLILLAKIVISVALLWLLVTRSDVPRLWAYARSASLPWLATALALYFLMVLASAWRWGLLLDAQGVHLRVRALTASFLVATFFNNFLPSNIGGDVVRIADTAKPARSRTLAASVVLVDRGIGLLGLILLAAVAATLATTSGSADG